MSRLPPYSPIFLRATARNLFLPWILLYLYLPITGSTTIATLIYLIAPLCVYSCHVYLRTAYFHHRANRLGAIMIPVIKPTPTSRSPTWLESLGRIGNVGLMLAWEKEGKEGYLGEGMVRSALEGGGGIVNTKILGEDSMITSHPGTIHQILSHSFSSFPKGPKFHERAKGLFGPRGIFGGDGEDWVFRRSSTRPFLSKTSSGAYDVSTLEPHTSKLISLILRPSGSSAGEIPAVDVQSLFLTYTMDAASGLFMGHCVGGLDKLVRQEEDTDGDMSHRLEDEVRKGVTQGGPDRDERQVTGAELTEAFAEAQAVLSRRIKMGTPWALFELTGNKMTKPVETVKKFIRPLVDRAYRRRYIPIADGEGEGQGEREHGGTLLDHLVESLDDREAIADELINILVAARDTTASALTFCVYCLVLHPKCMDKLRKELRQRPSGSAWTYADLKDGEYGMAIHCFVQEVLRLYPPVPMNIRRSATEIVLRGSPPVYMPAHTSIILATLLMQRSKVIWGEDAEEFRPERWEPSDVTGDERFLGRGSIPFSAGPRTCLGQNFALMQIKHVLTRLLEGLDDSAQELALVSVVPPPKAWSALEGRGRHEKVCVSSNLTLQVKGGLWVKPIRQNHNGG